MFLTQKSLQELEQEWPELKVTDLYTFRSWYLQQLHLPILSDEDLALFLHASRYSVEKAKIRVVKYFDMRDRTPRIFSDRDPSFNAGIQTIIRRVAIIPLNAKIEKYKIILIKVIEPCMQNYEFVNVLKYFHLVMDYLVYVNGIDKGYFIAVDMTEFTEAYVAGAKDEDIIRCFSYFINGAPFRALGVHLFNTKLNEVILSQHLGEQTQKMIFKYTIFYESLANLKALIHHHYLPQDMKGIASKIFDIHKLYAHRIYKKRKWLVQLELRNIVYERLYIDRPTDPELFLQTDKDAENDLFTELSTIDEYYKTFIKLRPLLPEETHQPSTDSTAPTIDPLILL